MNKETTTQKLPPWFAPAQPASIQQDSLFKVSIESVLARIRVSPDELNRWHARGWISFAFVPMELSDHDDPKIWELQFVRDVVRSGMTDAQITQLFDRCPKPHSFDPDRTAFSFRYGLVQAIPPVEPDEPDGVIENHLEEWIAKCDDKEQLLSLNHQIIKRINNL